MTITAQHEQNQTAWNIWTSPEGHLNKYHIIYRLTFHHSGRRTGPLPFSCVDKNAWRALRRFYESLNRLYPRVDYPAGQIALEICEFYDTPWVTFKYVDGREYWMPRRATALPNGKGYRTS